MVVDPFVSLNPKPLMFKSCSIIIMTALSLNAFRFMLAMGYSDVMPLSMLQHVQMNLEEYRGNGKKSKKTLGDDFEEKTNAGVFQMHRARMQQNEIWRETMGDDGFSGDEESEIRAQVRQWEENMDVYDLTRQAVDMFAQNVKCVAFALFVVDDSNYNHASCTILMTPV